MKRVTSLLLVLAMLLCLAACAPSQPTGGSEPPASSPNSSPSSSPSPSQNTKPENSGTPDPAPAGENVDDGKLTIWTWDPTFNIAAMNVAKEMYQADHPDVEIEVIEVGNEDIDARVIASNGDTSTLPDILLVQDNAFQKFVINYPEVYCDLTGKYDYSNFSPAKVAYSTVNGHNYGIPFDAGTAVAAWRTDYLDQAGYTIDDLTNISWDRFLEIGRKVKETTGHPMLSGLAGQVDTVLIMLQSCGSSMFNADGSVNLKDNAELKEVVNVYNTMVKEGIYLEVNSWDEYIGSMSNGSVVGTINGCWILGTIMSLEDQAGKWDITNMPKLVNAAGKYLWLYKWHPRNSSCHPQNPPLSGKMFLWHMPFFPERLLLSLISFRSPFQFRIP